MDDDDQVVSDGGDTNALGGTVAQPVATNDNPAWSAQLDKFPDSVKHIAREAFTDWDKGVQQKFQGIHDQYAPYKHYIDEGVDPEKLQSAYGLSQMLESDPPAFARLLADQLGMTISEAEAAVEELQADEDDTPVDPRYAALEEQQQKMMEFLQSQEEQKQEQIENQRSQQALESELATLEQQHGRMTPEIKNQVLREALRISYETGEPTTMTAAYNSLEAFVSSIRQVPRPGQLAPRVMQGGSSAVMPSNKSLGAMSNTETKTQVAELVARMQAGQ